MITGQDYVYWAKQSVKSIPSIEYSLWRLFLQLQHYGVSHPENKHLSLVKVLCIGSVRACVCVCVCVCLYVYMYVCMHVFMYVFMQACVYV